MRAQLLSQCAKGAKTPAVVAEIEAERALDTLAGGDRDQSLRLLDHAWRTAPDSASVREAACAIGEASIAAGDSDIGRQILRALARDEKAPRADRAIYQLGFASLSAGDARAALGELARFAQRFPDSPLRLSAQFLEAEANYRAGELERSLALFEALAKAPLAADLQPKVLFRTGILHCRKDRWREGESELTRLAEEFPKFENGLEAKLWLGRAQAQRKDGAQARATLAAVADADKGMLGAQARLSLGELALESGDTEAALASFLRVAVLYSDIELVAAANWGAGRAFEHSGDLEKAAQSYREVLTKAPKSSLAAGARERLGGLASR